MAFNKKKEGNKKRFCTAFSCIDGRVQEEVRRWAAEELHVDVVDFVPLGNACGGFVNVQDSKERHRLLSAARISVTRNGSTDAVVVCHSEKADTRMAQQEHRKHMGESVRVIKGTKLFRRVYGVFVEIPKELRGKVTKVCSLPACS